PASDVASVRGTGARGRREVAGGAGRGRRLSPRRDDRSRAGNEPPREDDDIFYDAWHEASLASFDAMSRLREIYSARSQLTVVFLDSSYGDRDWTRLEWEAIQEISRHGRDEQLMLIALSDPGKIPGLPHTFAYTDAQRGKLSPEAIADLVVKRLESTPVPELPELVPREEPLRLFICYRREDIAAQATAPRVYEKLIARFGEERVFWDIDRMKIGCDYRVQIDEQVGKCHVMLALIAGDWLKIMRERIDRERDDVRLEIEIALKRNIPIVPLMLNGAEMPSSHELPSPMEDFAFRHGFEVDYVKRFHQDMDELIELIENL
ncbi:MAG: TIR domain-containing protein, partial [Verrucomicrobiota bacterium]